MDGETPKSEKPRFYWAEDAAREIGVAAQVIRKLAQKGLMKGKQCGLGARRRWAFTPDEVERVKRAYAPPVASCA